MMYIAPPSGALYLYATRYLLLLNVFEDRVGLLVHLGLIFWCSRYLLSEAQLIKDAFIEHSFRLATPVKLLVVVLQALPVSVEFGKTTRP